MSETAVARQIGGGKSGRKGYAWVAALYFAVTLVVNLGALVAVPKMTTPEIARQTLPFYVLPVLWAGYLLFRYRTTPLRWVGFLAAVPGLLWLLAVIGDIVLIIRN